MADAAVEIQFIAAGAESTQKHIITLQHQLKQLSQTIASMPKLDIGGGANGGDVGFKKEVWREFHNIFAGIEEELDRVVQAVNKLNAAMEKSASGGTRANTEAIKAQTAAMKDLSNTNAMLHEVLIGEAPLNVEIQKTRKGIAVASQEAAKQTENLAKKTDASAKGMKGFGRFSRETASVLGNMLAPGLGMLVNQLNAVFAAFRAIIATPIGATFAVLGGAIYGIYRYSKKIAEQKFDTFEIGIKSLTRRVEALKRELQGVFDLLGRNKDVFDDAPGLGSKDMTSSQAKGRGEQSARNAIKTQEDIFNAQIRRAYLQEQLKIAQQKKNSAIEGIMWSESGFTIDHGTREKYESSLRETEKEIKEIRREIAEIDILEKELERNKKRYEDNALRWEKIASDAEVKEIAEREKKKLEEEKKAQEEKKKLRNKETEEDIEREIKRRQRVSEERQRELEMAWNTQRDIGSDVLGTYLSSGGSMKDSGAQALLKMINTSKTRNPDEQIVENTRITFEVLREIRDRMEGRNNNDLIWARAY